MRVYWCLERQAYDWSIVMFPDESAMQNGIPQGIFDTKGLYERYERDCFALKYRKLRSYLAWGAITFGCKSELLFWDSKAHVKINAEGYIDHILPVVVAGFQAV